MRSTIRPSTSAAIAFLTTLCGSADEANSRTGVPGATLRWEPSGSVMVTIDNLELRSQNLELKRGHEEAQLTICISSGFKVLAFKFR